MLLEGRDLCDFSHQPLYSLSSYFLEKSHLKERKVKMIKQLIVLLLPFRCIDLKVIFHRAGCAPLLLFCSQGAELEVRALTAPGAPACPELACPASGEMKRKKEAGQTILLEPSLSSLRWVRANHGQVTSMTAAYQLLCRSCWCSCYASAITRSNLLHFGVATGREHDPMVR